MNFRELVHYVQMDKFLLNCTYCTNVGVAEFAYCCIKVVSERIFHFPVCIFCNSISLFIFLSKRKAIYKRIFLNTFQVKVQKLPIGSLIINWNNRNIFIIRQFVYFFISLSQFIARNLKFYAVAFTKNSH